MGAESFLHHYRWLLREATYLPTAASRRYVRQTIIHRFRTYVPRPPLTPPSAAGGTYAPQPPKEPPSAANEPGRQTALLKECRHAWSVLRRANDGKHRCLEKIFNLTYGRTGRRRHALLRPWLHGPGNQPPGQEAQLPGGPAIRDAPDRQLHIPPALRAIIQAHLANERTRRFRPFSKNARKPEGQLLPAENNWGRRMPYRRIKNRKKAVYNELKEKLLPPLPDEEYEGLRRLAVGEEELAPVPNRRGGTAGGEITEGHGRERPAIERRAQRALFKTLLLSTRIGYDKAQKRWIVTWYDAEKERKQRALQPRDEDMFLFASQESGASAAA